MAVSELAIALDRANATYHPGEAISGCIQASCDAAACRGKLSVALRWAATGRGDRDEGDAGRVDFGLFAWQPDERASMPFELRAPHGPLSHAGKAAGIEWSLSAKAAVAWGSDATAAHGIELTRWPDDPLAVARDYRSAPRAQRWQGRYELGAAFRMPKPVRSRRAPASYVAGVLTALAGAAVPFVVAGVAGAWAVELGLGGLAAGTAFQSLVRKRAGRSRLVVTPLASHPGESLDVHVRLEPRGAWRVKGVRVTLIGREQARSDLVDPAHAGGRAPRDTEHVVHEQTHELLSETLTVHEPTELEAVLRIPALAPTSFDTGHHAVEWHVSAHVDVEGLPAHTHLQPIALLP